MGGWLYKHESITKSVEVGAGAELGNSWLNMTETMTMCQNIH